MLDAALARDSKKCEALILAHIKVLDTIVDAIKSFNNKA